MNETEHQAFLLLALAEAEKGRGFCAPNPAVGALLVREGQIISRGYHAGPGELHAEMAAIAQSEAPVKRSVLYCTLEPCCHHGRTPPCTEGILSQGIRAVYFAELDPNPRVAGQGQAKLQAAGVYCEQILIPKIKSFYQSYQHWTQTGFPLVTAKLAISLDGKIAGPDGKPVQITGPALAKETHERRKRSDAILTTSKTIIQDNPQFNVRIDHATIAKPLYVLDRQLRLPLDACVHQTAASITLFHEGEADHKRKQVMEARGVRCVMVPSQNEKLDLRTVLKLIGQAGVHDLWSEVGAECFSALADQALLDRVLLYIGRTWVGEGVPAFEALPLMLKNAKHITWQEFDCEVMGIIERG